MDCGCAAGDGMEFVQKGIFVMNAVRAPIAETDDVSPASPEPPVMVRAVTPRHAGKQARTARLAPLKSKRNIRDSIAGHYRARLRPYARLKLRHDPVYDVVADELCGASAPVLDVGSGIGLLGFYLRARGFTGAYTGIDSDEAKVAAAMQAAESLGSDLTFANVDANALPAFSGTVVLLDMIHYLERDQQHALLFNAARRVTAGGLLILRTVLREPRWRFVATRWEERLLHGIGWMPRARHFPARSDIETALHAYGFRTQVRPLWGMTPFASFLIVARRRSLR